MATVEEVISLVDDIKPNAFTEKQKTLWLSELEARIQQEVLLLWRGETVRYRWPEDRGTGLLLEEPEDALYRHWLEAMIDYANGEYSKYQNTMELFNACWDAFLCQFANTWRPADGYDAGWSKGVWQG